jgi:AmpE protein
MIFLALMITLILRQLRDPGEPVSGDDWFERWQAHVATWNVGSVGQLAAAILPVVLLAQLLLNALAPVLFGLLWIALAVILLQYALGRGDFQQRMARYRSRCLAADFEGAYLDTLLDLDHGQASDSPQSQAWVHERVQRNTFYEGYQRWFPVVFYFVLLGPAAALAYRLLHLCRQRDASAFTERCLLVADWLPARLLAATFTLAGNFVGSRDTLLGNLGDPAAAADSLLYEVGTAALDTPTGHSAQEQPYGEYAAGQSEATTTLLTRSAIGWVVLIAVFVLLG